MRKSISPIRRIGAGLFLGMAGSTLVYAAIPTVSETIDLCEQGMNCPATRDG